MRLFLIFFIVIVYSACKPGNSKAIDVRANKNDSADKIATFGGDDAEMNNARAAARNSYSAFLDTLMKGCDNCDRFAVKIRLAINDIDGEHVWLDSIRKENGKIFGILASVPEQVSSMNLNDKLEVKIDSLSDWMYVQNGKLVGGYTLKVMFDKMSEPEKKQLEEQFGAKIR